MYETCHARCENQINSIQQRSPTYNSCLSQQPQQNTGPNQSVQQIIQQQQDQQKASDLQLQQEEDQLQQETCISSYGPYAIASGNNSCVCQTGYQLDSSNSLCETPTMFCHNTLGSNSQPILVQQNGTNPIVVSVLMDIVKIRAEHALLFLYLIPNGQLNRLLM